MYRETLIVLIILAGCGSSNAKNNSRAVPTPEELVTELPETTENGDTIPASSPTSTRSSDAVTPPATVVASSSNKIATLEIHSAWDAIATPPAGMRLGQVDVGVWTGSEVVMVDNYDPARQIAAAYDPVKKIWRLLAMPSSLKYLHINYLAATEDYVLLWGTSRYDPKLMKYNPTNEYFLYSIVNNLWTSISNVDAPPLPDDYNINGSKIFVHNKDFVVLSRKSGGIFDEYHYKLAPSVGAWQKVRVQNTPDNFAVRSESYSLDGVNGDFYRWGDYLSQPATVINNYLFRLKAGAAMWEKGAAYNRAVDHPATSPNGVVDHDSLGFLKYFNYATQEFSVGQYLAKDSKGKLQPFDYFPDFELICGDYFIQYGGEGFEREYLKTSDAATTTLFALNLKTWTAGHAEQDRSKAPAWRAIRGVCAGDRVLMWGGVKEYREISTNNYQGIAEDIGYELQLSP